MFIQKVPLTLTVAILLNFILVGPVVKMIFFKLIFKPTWKSKLIKMNLVLSTMIILGMVSLMSLFGIIGAFGINNLSLLKYIHTWLLNFLVAVPIQLIVVGRSSRYLISKIISDTDGQIKEIK